MGTGSWPLKHTISRKATLGDIIYYIVNADLEKPETVLWVGLTRHRVERCFQDQKSNLGLDHYEGRTYVGLMRHLFLTLVSYLFLMRAVLRRRGEKSGVDSSPSPSGSIIANYRNLG